MDHASSGSRRSAGTSPRARRASSARPAAIAQRRRTRGRIRSSAGSAASGLAAIEPGPGVVEAAVLRGEVGAGQARIGVVGRRPIEDGADLLGGDHVGIQPPVLADGDGPIAGQSDPGDLAEEPAHLVVPAFPDEELAQLPAPRPLRARAVGSRRGGSARRRPAARAVGSAAGRRRAGPTARTARRPAPIPTPPAPPRVGRAWPRIHPARRRPRRCGDTRRAAGRADRARRRGRRRPSGASPDQPVADHPAAGDQPTGPAQEDRQQPGRDAADDPRSPHDRPPPRSPAARSAGRIRRVRSYHHRTRWAVVGRGRNPVHDESSIEMLRDRVHGLAHGRRPGG